MTEDQPTLGAVAITKTTYKAIGKMARPALALVTIPFIASFLAALIAVGDPDIGFVKSVFLGFVQFLANVIFAAALLRHVLQNAPASVHVLQMGRVEWHMLAVSVIVVLIIFPVSYVITYAMDLFFMVLDVFDIELGIKWIANGFEGLFYIVYVFLISRYVIAWPLILLRGDSFVGALAGAWTMTRGRVWGVFLVFALVMVPIGAVSEIGMEAEDYFLHGQSNLIRAFVNVFGAYFDVTALTIFSAVVFQGLSPTVEPVRTS